MPCSSARHLSNPLKRNIRRYTTPSSRSNPQQQQQQKKRVVFSGIQPTGTPHVRLSSRPAPFVSHDSTPLHRSLGTTSAPSRTGSAYKVNLKSTSSIPSSDCTPSPSRKILSSSEKSAERCWLPCSLAVLTQKGRRCFIKTRLTPSSLALQVLVGHG